MCPLAAWPALQKLRLGEIWTKLMEAEQRASAGGPSSVSVALCPAAALPPGLAGQHPAPIACSGCSLLSLVCSAALPTPPAATNAAFRSPMGSGAATSAADGSQQAGLVEAWQLLEAATAAASASAAREVQHTRRQASWPPPAGPQASCSAAIEPHTLNRSGACAGRTCALALVTSRRPG
jgi:hypothetical protein